MIPNYTNAFNTAYDALYNYSPRELPIDLERFVAKLKVIKLRTYSELCVGRKIEFSEAVGFLGSDLGALVRHRNRYIIYYNDKKRSPYLDRFTIAHELGHFFLNHLEEGEMLAGELGAEEHDIFEKEANCFARNLLSPILLLESLLPNMKSTEENIETISRYFAISKQAAKARLDMYPFDKACLKEYHGDSWDSFTYIPWKVCRKCSNITLAEGFCEICAQDFSQPTGSIHPNALIKVPARIYNAPTDISCESCGEKLHLPYETSCTKCGRDMANYCFGGEGVHSSPLYLDNLAARHCSKCGNESTYKTQGFLQPYQKEKVQIMDRISFVKGRREYLLQNEQGSLVREIKVGCMDIFDFDESMDI